MKMKIDEAVKLSNKTALVTGASTGIGRAIAVELANEGATVFLTARNKEKLEETKKLIDEAGGRAYFIAGDLSDLTGSLFGMANYISGAVEQLDILINTAGIWHGNNEVYAGKKLEDFSEKVIIDTFNVGTIAPILLAFHLVDKMPAGSSIINISGTFENGAQGWLPYYVSKRAIEDLTIGLAQEFEEKGIKVNCISPSDTATQQYQKYFPNDAKDAQKPQDVAKLVIELIGKNETGKVYIIKNNQVREGFHK